MFEKGFDHLPTYVTSQVLVIAAIVISYQLQFFQNKDLGFEEESVLVVDIHGDEPIEKKLALQK